MKQIDALRFAFTGQLMLAGRQWRQISHHALAHHSVSAAAAAPLLFIRRLGGGVRQVTLADYVGVEGATLVRLVDQLCAAGLARREVDPHDRRANSLSLTEAGDAAAIEIEEALRNLRAEVFADISAEDMAATLRVLEALARAAAAAGGTGKAEA
ncbi:MULTISPECIES: MarR family winged helix-turn-helix transcriptional regulator [Cupriavidus]|jgi:MarR family transcriptional regulator for hemolysin|uniref:Winged helix DNA-binding protein n=1 Tax=Cupriavidus pauculus TaxID=82633 RepID=A0A5P2HGA3_9BURK|nr:MarR family transcriptional regulator [Cupriavidus pauculus]QET06265.1 winged helix DNA-binding protein [Cupriavidus pauculus]